MPTENNNKNALFYLRRMSEHTFLIYVKNSYREIQIRREVLGVQDNL